MGKWNRKNMAEQIDNNKYLFKEHQISTGQLSANSSSTEMLHCLISLEISWTAQLISDV